MPSTTEEDESTSGGEQDDLGDGVALVTEGDFVLDGDADEDDQDLAIVIKATDTPISEWELDPDSDDSDTVEDHNPDYYPSERAVLISYVESGLENRWPSWREDYPDLYDGVLENGVAFYSFPETRLEPAPEIVVAETLADQ